MGKNGLLEIIAEHRTGDALDEIMARDKDYQDALAQYMALWHTVLEWRTESDLYGKCKRAHNQNVAICRW